MNLTCATCGKKFSTIHQIKNHYATSVACSLHTCPMCSKRCSDRPRLREHMRIHTGERPYACPLCPQKFAASCNLHPHIRRRHTPIERYDYELGKQLRAKDNRIGPATSDAFWDELSRAPNHLGQCPYCQQNVSNVPAHTLICPARPGPQCPYCLQNVSNVPAHTLICPARPGPSWRE